MTAPKITVDIPSEVSGVEFKIRNAILASSTPVVVRVVASVWYVILNGIAYALPMFIVSPDFFLGWTD